MHGSGDSTPMTLTLSYVVKGKVLSNMHIGRGLRRSLPSTTNPKFNEIGIKAFVTNNLRIVSIISRDKRQDNKNCTTDTIVLFCFKGTNFPPKNFPYDKKFMSSRRW